MCVGKIKRIKSLVTLEQILDFYGIERYGRYIKCPFHNDRSPSMIVHKDRVHCFGCGLTLDIIDFVAKYNNVSISKAIDIIDTIFQCGINEPLSEDEYNKLLVEMEEKKVERENNKKIQDFAEECLQKIAKEMQDCRDKINDFEETLSKLDVIYRDFDKSFDNKVTQSVRAKFRIQWLDWLYSVIQDQVEMYDDKFILTYGDNRLEILNKIYNGEIKI